jgi:ABC-2 type transport system ATP-binding protein
MNEAEYCDRIAIIDRGKIVNMGTPDELKKEVGGDIISLRGPHPEALRKEIEKMDGFKVHCEDGVLQFEVKEGEAVLPHLIKEVKESIDTVELRRPTLDDVFLRMTGRSIREEEATAKERMREKARQHHH